jgi:hypothetical protein
MGSTSESGIVTALRLFPGARLTMFDRDAMVETFEQAHPAIRYGNCWSAYPRPERRPHAAGLVEG